MEMCPKNRIVSPTSFQDKIALWSIHEILDTSEKHDTAQGSVMVNSISQFLHLVKVKIEKTFWEKLYVRFGSRLCKNFPTASLATR